MAKTNTTLKAIILQLKLIFKKLLKKKNTSTPLSIAALFTTVRTQKQPKHPSRGMDKENAAHKCSGMSVIKRNETGSLAKKQMNLETVIRAESERKKQILYINTYMWDLEK